MVLPVLNTGSPKASNRRPTASSLILNYTTLQFCPICQKHLHTPRIAADAPNTAVRRVLARLLHQSPSWQHLLASLYGALLLAVSQLRRAATPALETNQWPDLVTKARSTSPPLCHAWAYLGVRHAAATALLLEALTVARGGSHWRLLWSGYRRLGVYFFFELTENKKQCVKWNDKY